MEYDQNRKTNNDRKEILNLAMWASSDLGFFVSHNSRPTNSITDRGSSLRSFSYLNRAKRGLDVAHEAMLREVTPEAHRQLSKLSDQLLSDFTRIAYWPHPHFVRPDDRDIEPKGPTIDEKNYTTLTKIAFIEQITCMSESLGWGYKSHDSNRQRRPYQLTLLGTAASIILRSENSD